ncbi:claudin-10-like isoform X2 [Poecilia reticulata]|uniref:claudin-10-like isoform X2 n=1 Tax=Poecilia reticulata TaxID=8081 RepID=UPI0004A2B001|nr:PREDICTED: claudin-10-like isoform X2 [Poecilia reticulata]
MKKRLIQIFGFLITSLGWVFILSTMAMDNWRISQMGGQGGSFIIKVAWYWSNLWKDCYTESSSVTNCKEYGVLWGILYYVQAVRGLLMCGLTIGFVAVVCCFVGMECTYIGGAEPTKDKLVFSGAVFHFVGGVPNLVAYCLYINRIARSAYATNLPAGELRYELGPPTFLGLVGCFLIFFGAVLYAVTVIKVIYPNRTVIEVYGRPTYMPPSYRGRSLYTGYYQPSRLNGSYASGRSSSKISKQSQATSKLSERDAFV